MDEVNLNKIVRTSVQQWYDNKNFKKKASNHT
jgi:hypothetical protein